MPTSDHRPRPIRDTRRPRPDEAAESRRAAQAASAHALAPHADPLDVPQRFGGANRALLALLHQLRLLGRGSEGAYVSLHKGQVVCDRNEIFQHAYFPLTSRLAFECVLDDGRSVELASAGDDSFAGWPLLTGGGSMPFRTTVTVAGTAFCCTASALDACLRAEPSLETRMLACIGVLFAEVSQKMVCIKLHAADERVAYHLLTLRDYSTDATLDASAASIAHALGFTDRCVRSVLQRFNDDGILAARRSAVSILDRPRLEARSCECYRVLRALHRPPPGDEPGHAR